MDSVTIKTTVNPSKILKDLRVGRRGLVFGTVENVAAQYGVTISNQDGYTVFTAPKKRMQIFAERLHYSGVRFVEL